MSEREDTRNALVLVEPWWRADGSIDWHGMAFAGGQVVNDIVGSDRTVVLEDCIDALAGAGVATDTENRAEMVRSVPSEEAESAQ